ncbi:DUF721 domain-containing protein [Granulicella sp. WH15]|uniref:DciA family protein n=1 Tax=Granulicella sp. WH15 TaxID=2602070 RepID=UPI00136720C1|nr:DciA family protein [Granulicella sp. WH15]QHN02124.1 DUF721 domain-containing protein [Granulicella sp. WH15]
MEGMRDMLRRSLGRSLAPLPALDRLAAAWPVACGKTMADRGEIASFEEGVVHVEVQDSTWLAQMLSMRSILQHDLARIAAVKVTGIHFELKK